MAGWGPSDNAGARRRDSPAEAGRYAHCWQAILVFDVAYYGRGRFRTFFKLTFKTSARTNKS